MPALLNKKSDLEGEISENCKALLKLLMLGIAKGIKAQGVGLV